MHQTLYRKYRPRSLNDICGQDVIITILGNQFKNEKTVHAYLFSGPRGTGKTSVAKIFARSLNCEGKVKPCGECNFCKQRQEDTLDIIEIDAASNNGVDEIRELKSKISLAPTYGKNKIYIIDEVHMLTSSAFNALLKTLEEPPRYATFILATTEPHKVPETILSRCQRLDFLRLSEQAIKKRLEFIKNEEKISIEDSALEEIARLAQGGMRDAISLMEQASAYSPTLITVSDVHKINGSLDEKELKELLKEMENGRLDKILLKIDQYYGEGKNMVKVTEELIDYLRKELVEMKCNKTTDKELETKKLEKILRLNQFLYDMKQDNNPKTLFEIALIDYAEEFGDVPRETLKEEKNDVPRETLKKEKNNVSRETLIKEEKNNVPRGTLDEKSLEKLKRIRIDNTFSKVSRQFKTELNEQLKIKMFEIVKKNGHLLFDGEIVAASDEHQYFIIRFDSITCAEMYNGDLKRIEKILKEELKMKIKTIAVDNEEWDQYREEFKNKKRKYQFVEENGEAEKVKKNEEKNEIEHSFADLIETK